MPEPKVTEQLEEEEKAGVTFNKKIENAFRDARLFIEEQSRENPNEKLEFEGIAHWHGHGTSLRDNISSEDEILYHEGSLEFLFITRHLNNGEVESIDKTTIKRLEQENLREYRYFIHDFHSCCSGAAIA